VAFVEHTSPLEYPPFVWAKEIKVSVGDQEIEVSGVSLMIEEDYRAAPDSLRAYRQAISRYGGEKRQGKNSPHVQFANADDIAGQVAFLKQYGPVLSSSSETEERAVSSRGHYDFGFTETVITARQNIAELESEQSIYRSALVLIAELRRAKKIDIPRIRECLSPIVRNVSAWPRQWEREQRMRASGVGYAHEPRWKFTDENVRHLEYFLWRAMQERSDSPSRDALLGLNPVRDGHLVISEIVNAFAPVVYPWGDSPVEAPHWDVATGIRPLLYYMLRREYLSTGGVGICRNSDCRAIFEIERSGQEFCGEECSRRQRQREYWRVRGKKLRQRRKSKRDSGIKSRQAREGKQR
jgi:hypothetical protein